MATKKPANPTVGARVLANGDVALGVTVGGKFAPILVTPEFRVTQLQENYAGAGGNNDDDDTEGGS